MVRGIIGFFRGLSSAKNVEVVRNAKTSMTKVLTDPITDNITLTREIRLASTGKTALATTKTEQLPDGMIKITTRIEDGGDNPIQRVKTIKREYAASVFGGDRITVNKHESKYWCHGKDTKVVKDYSSRGLEHTELEYKYSAGNGLYDVNHTAMQDRVYDGFELSHSVDEMLKSPNEFQHVKASLDGRTNYYKFADKGTNYERAVEAKKQAVIDAAKKTDEEQRLAKEAAEKAAKELAAKRPRVNVGKILGCNIEDLKVVEKTRPNGEIARYYFVPENNIPVIKTVDKGSLHQEWIMNGKQDFLYAKFVGKEEPYIAYRNGKYTQISGVKDKIVRGEVEKERLDMQCYNDGLNSLRRYPSTGYHVRGKISFLDESAKSSRELYPSIANTIPDYPQYRINAGSVVRDSYSGWTANERKAERIANNIQKQMDENLVDLKDLFKLYEA